MNISELLKSLSNYWVDEEGNARPATDKINHDDSNHTTRALSLISLEGIHFQ